MLRCLEVKFLSLSASCVAVSSICAAPFSNMCSTQADNNSLKLRLRCGCQFPWCAHALTAVTTKACYRVTVGWLRDNMGRPQFNQHPSFVVTAPERSLSQRSQLRVRKVRCFRCWWSSECYFSPDLESSGPVPDIE
jgi:hypothetical protein